ncbi:hypothetical protein BKA56DRAFT_579155 [Ilyonectria sp. MPI-CAGE-AT-0026]|nr:hypothetical protein BKA56DRAFT_579155 [Ilyonectria sp. MPI-CAGE-AT-0026]
MRTSQTRMKRRELGCAKLNAKPQWRGSSEMSVVGRDWRMDGWDDSTGWPWRIRCRILAGVLRGTQYVTIADGGVARAETAPDSVSDSAKTTFYRRRWRRDGGGASQRPSRATKETVCARFWKQWNTKQRPVGAILTAERSGRDSLAGLRQGLE